MLATPIPILLLIIVVVAGVDIIRGIVNHDDFEN